MEAQRQADLAGDWWLVGEASGQLALMPAADAFYRQVVWDSVGVGGFQSPQLHPFEQAVLPPGRAA